MRLRPGFDPQLDFGFLRSRFLAKPPDEGYAFATSKVSSRLDSLTVACALEAVLGLLGC
jgi:hypothetical protein